ncbi:MAG: MarR family transcriptional regulator [Thermonemataceae bacterium]|nr:MarR family transcriptional regulator [Thermonemataceae bacterium]
MKTIEQAIQSRFRNNRHKAIVNLLYTAKYMESLIEKIIKPYDLSQQQFNILRIVRGASAKPLTLKYIKERMLDQMPDASRVVEKLCKKELLKRTTCDADRRSVDISITQKGLDLLAELDTHSEKMDALMQLSDNQLEQFNTLLDSIRN